MTDQVAILMSTYNGEKYLQEQIDSLIAQTHKEWTLYIRDDGSSDQTLEIIHQYQQKDTRIFLTEDDFGNLRPKNSFEKLMEYAKDHLTAINYFMFCDQDDKWLPDKIEDSLACMKKLELTAGEDVPLLIHTDLVVVDEQLTTMSPSFMKHCGLRPGGEKPLGVLLWHNFVTGCTALINQSLLKLSVPIDDSAVIHDWWCALVAAAYGKIAFLDKQTILYRQHGVNTYGAVSFWDSIKKGYAERKSISKNFHSKARVAASLLKMKEQKHMSLQVKKTLKDFTRLHLVKKFARPYLLIRNHILPQGFVRVILKLIAIMLFV